MPAQSKLNVRLLRRIQKHILEEPRRVWMDLWIIKGRDAIKGYFGKGNHVPECGTIGCIAGWAVMLRTKSKQVYGYGISSNAKKLLGLDDVQAVKLFGTGSWPEHFQEKLADANHGTKRYAKAVSDRIDHFIETKGAE